MSENEILILKGEYLNIPTKALEGRGMSFEVLKYVPEESAIFYKFVPLGIKDGVLEVGIVDAENIEARDALSFIASKLGIPFKLYLISPSDFNVAIENYKGLTGEVNKALSELDRELPILRELNFMETLKVGTPQKGRE